MSQERSDTLVLFGATGDLAHKKIFPALYHMVAKGTLAEPVIGVAFDPWDTGKLVDRARDGIVNTFAVGNHLDAQGHYPLYVAYEDYSAGVDNVMLTASYDGGTTWSPAIQVNDNASAVDEFQPNLSVSPSGTVSIAWYDRRLACPSGGGEAVAAGLALDPGSAGAANYCVNSSVQFYDANLHALGRNIRLTAHTWDPQLNSPHTSCATCTTTFIGDYFGIISAGGTLYTTSVTTVNDGKNAAHYQQQVISTISIP